MQLEMTFAIVGWICILTGLITLAVCRFLTVFFAGIGLALQAQYYLIHEGYTQTYSPHILWVPIVIFFIAVTVVYLVYRRRKEQSF
jgi:H+/Cl- antiporter ClcA